ncbi:MAG: rplU [Firmicutes bacterium]|nr:rplU [Bacillota bacterium]
MYAIIETGGKQYRVAEGDMLTIEKLEVTEGQTFDFDRVLTVVKDGEVVIGKPLVANAKVR